MERAEIERVLAEALSDPLPPEELEDVIDRAARVRTQAALLRELPLEMAEEPASGFSLEADA